MKPTKAELEKILDEHRKWLDKKTGARADLTRADLRGADLVGAVLTRADLRDAVLTRADLRGADLAGADLRGADLTRADLTRADLRGAVLAGAVLTRADLRGAKQRIIIITGSRHTIYAIDDDVRIGCLRYSLADWLIQYQRIGDAQEYTPTQVAEYGIYLNTIKAVLEIKKE